jgi:hypothetical protein
MGKDKKKAPGCPPGRRPFSGEIFWQMATLPEISGENPHFLEEKIAKLFLFFGVVLPQVSLLATV